MKVITRQKPREEILAMVEDYARIFIAGCGTCPTVCRTGGVEEIAGMEAVLREAGKLVTGRVVLTAACDVARDLFLEQQKKEIESAQAMVVMSCGLGVQNLAGFEVKIVVPALDSLFFGVEGGSGEFQESCRQCGECVLGYTAGICPVTLCHKGLLNGPCGGTKDGQCEVGQGRACAWALIHARLEKFGRLDLLRKYLPPRNLSGQLRPGQWKLEETPGAGEREGDKP